MARQLVDINETIATGGEYTETVSLSGFSYDPAEIVRQAEITTSTDTDVHVETRLADDLSWVSVDSETGLADGASTVATVDTGNFNEVRVRITNNDGTNAADVRVVIVA